MKISELAAASGESIPTLKFYIREQLLPPGRSLKKTQARYDEDHLKRLSLIRILKTELNMSVEKIREVLLQAEESGRESRSGLKSEEQSSPELGKAWALLTELENELDWHLHPKDSIAADVAKSLTTILRVMPDAQVENSLLEYARMMKSMADREIPDPFDPAVDPWESLRSAILGTYLFEPLILSLRRLAHGQRTFEVMEARRKCGR